MHQTFSMIGRREHDDAATRINGGSQKSRRAIEEHRVIRIELDVVPRVKKRRPQAKQTYSAPAGTAKPDASTGGTNVPPHAHLSSAVSLVMPVMSVAGFE